MLSVELSFLPIVYCCDEVLICFEVLLSQTVLLIIVLLHYFFLLHLQECFPGNIHMAYIIKPGGFWEKQRTSLGSAKYNFEVSV